MTLYHGIGSKLPRQEVDDVRKVSRDARIDPDRLRVDAAEHLGALRGTVIDRTALARLMPGYSIADACIWDAGAVVVVLALIWVLRLRR